MLQPETDSDCRDVGSGLRRGPCHPAVLSHLTLSLVLMGNRGSFQLMCVEGLQGARVHSRRCH